MESMKHTEREQLLRRRAVELAKEMLAADDERLAIGCREMVGLVSQLVDHREESFVIFLIVADQIDHLPLTADPELVEPSYRARSLAEAREVGLRHKQRIDAGCREVVRRWTDGPESDVQGRNIPRGTIAMLVLWDSGESLGQCAVQWAVDALVDGYDVPSLRLLAGLDLDGWPDSIEAGKLVARALRELGIPEADRNARALEYVREVAAAIVAGEIGPQEGVDRIHRRVISPLNHPAELQSWCCLWMGRAADGSHSLADSRIDQAIVDYATTFSRAAAQPVIQPAHRAGHPT